MSEIKLELLIYRISLLLPFENLQNQKLATTWRIKLYMSLMLLVYYTFRISFCLQFENNAATNEYFTYYGKLWMFVDIFDFTFSTLSFGVIVLNGLITNKQQIEFFGELRHFDKMLFTSYGISVRRSRTRSANSCVLIAGLAFFLVHLLNSLAKNEFTFLTPYQKFAYFFTYYLESILSLLSALFYIHCTQLCRERLACVRKILRNYANLSTEQMDTVLQLYVRIHSQIMLINRFMGCVVLLKLTHDFTLGSSIVYLMCSSLFRASELADIWEMVIWFVQSVIGSILLTMAADVLMTEANECAEILSGLRTDVISVTKQKWLDNILLWIRHHPPVLNACGLFPIDLRLLFAMSCGIITYMIVLLQLQDVDDQSIKILDLLKDS